MNVYIAGPMRGIPNDNHEMFVAVAAKLRSLGYIVFSPVEHDAEIGTQKGETDGRKLKRQILWDLEAITNADFVVLLPGWVESTGVRLELEMARFLGVPVKSFAEVLVSHFGPPCEGVPFVVEGQQS